ncbi:hypothetical protein A2U01_0062601, partial [Trifolium medium]|nr:hypothetical protein [Trifolium medium]
MFRLCPAHACDNVSSLSGARLRQCPFCLCPARELAATYLYPCLARKPAAIFPSPAQEPATIDLYLFDLSSGDRLCDDLLIFKLLTPSGQNLCLFVFNYL